MEQCTLICQVRLELDRCSLTLVTSLTVIQKDVIGLPVSETLWIVLREAYYILDSIKDQSIWETHIYEEIEIDTTQDVHDCSSHCSTNSASCDFFVYTVSLIANNLIDHKKISIFSLANVTTEGPRIHQALSVKR